LVQSSLGRFTFPNLNRQTNILLSRSPFPHAEAGMLREVYCLGAYLFRCHLGMAGNMAFTEGPSSLSLAYRAEGELATRQTSGPTQDSLPSHRGPSESA
jgi:hypothetical protein